MKIDILNFNEEKINQSINNIIFRPEIKRLLENLYMFK